MRYLLILLFLLSVNTYAKPRLFCSLKQAGLAHLSFKNYPFNSDKHKHCTYSCFIAYKCGAIQSFHAGLLKEVIDIFTPGDADLKDLQANMKGIKISNEVEFQEDCGDICADHF